MRGLLLCLIFCSLSFYTYAQTCTANAGGDFEICAIDTIQLFGEAIPASQGSTAEWTVISSPMPVVIVDPNNLATTVLPLGTNTYEVGDYVFELCIDCPGDPSVQACNQIKVTVGDIINPPQILPHETQVCGDVIIIEGTPPDANVTPQWSVIPNTGISLTVQGNGERIRLQKTSDDDVCDYTIFYSHTIGSCKIETFTEVSFTEAYDNDLFIEMIDPNSCPACSRTISMRGSQFGCGGIVEWDVIPPPGVDKNDINFSSTDRPTTIVEVPVAGVYTFIYTVGSNLAGCPGATATLECEIFDLPGFEIGGDEIYLLCDNELDISPWNIAVNDIPGANYVWSGSSSDPDLNITINASGHQAEVIISPSPHPVPPNGLLIDISASAFLGPCADQKSIRLFVNPQSALETSDTSFLCGQGTVDFTRQVTFNRLLPGYFEDPVVVSSPTLIPGTAVPFNDPLTIVDPGEHCFEITYVTIGLDPATGNTLNFCESVDTICVLVTKVINPNAGSDIETCPDATQLNGSTPRDTANNPLAIDILWRQLSGPNTANILFQNEQDPFITNLEPGLYVFEYSYSRTFDCYLADTMMVRVLECEGCEINISQSCEEECNFVEVTGASSYRWLPDTGVVDPKSGATLVCANPGDRYIIKALDAHGDECASVLVQLDTCANPPPPPPPIDCESFYLVSSCYRCGGCGGLQRGRVMAYYGNGTVVDPSEVTITWYENGQRVAGPSIHFVEYDYDIPRTFTAHIQYTSPDGSIECDLELSAEVACEDDCPSFQFGTCADEQWPLVESILCEEDDGPCSDGGGYIYILDGAGNPVYDYIIDWYDDNDYDSNPFFLDLSNRPDCSEPIPVHIKKLGACDTILYYNPDCCGQIAPHLSCDESQEGNAVSWDPVCGTEYYVVEVWCIPSYELSEHIVTRPDRNGRYSFTLPPRDEGCEEQLVRVSGVCSSGENQGDWSNCILFYEGTCDAWEEACEYYLGDFGWRGQVAVDTEKSSEALQVYPNPLDGDQANIRLDKNWLNKQGQLELRIRGIDGQLVWTESLKAETALHSFSLEGLPSGLYLISIYDEQGQLLGFKPLVKNKK